MKVFILATAEISIKDITFILIKQFHNWYNNEVKNIIEYSDDILKSLPSILNDCVDLRNSLLQFDEHREEMSQGLEILQIMMGIINRILSKFKSPVIVRCDGVKDLMKDFRFKCKVLNLYKSF